MELRLQDLPIQASSNFVSSGIQKVYEYLAKRGVKTPAEIDALQLRILRCADIGKSGDERAAIVFPHFDPSGNQVDWWSARLVDVGPAPTGFAAMAPKSRGKMFCPAREAPDAYLVPTLDWSDIPEGAEIFIHESCLKAYAGARCHRYSVGLNGVWGWTSKKHDIALLHRIRDLPWAAKKLKCVVVFDSNAATNDDVALAIRRFAERMRLICKVDVKHRLLPPNPEGQDWGFDDYIELHGVEEGQKFLDGDAVSVDISEVEMLKLQLNDAVCVVRSLKRVAVQDTGVLMGRSDFCDVNYADYTAWVVEGERERQVNVPRMWLTWDHRRVVDVMDYLPGQPKIEGGVLNTWKGMGLEPSSGDVSMWLKVLETNVADPSLRDWMIKWMAYPLQNLGSKLSTFLHLYGPPGTGKQALFYPLRLIYGDNASIIGRENIASDFTSLYANKQFVNIDELHGGSSELGMKINNKVKRLVTQDTVVVNRKGEPEYEIRNCINLVSTSNYIDSIKLDEDDRRGCVARFAPSVAGALGEAFWLDYFAWVEGGGARAVYGYLLGVSLDGFNPQGWAPMTEHKKEVTEASRSAYEQWVKDLLEDPDSCLLPILKGAVAVTGKQLAMSYKAGDETEKSLHGLAKSLGRYMGSLDVPKREIRLAEGKERLWILKSDAVSWDNDKLRKHVQQFRGKV